MNSLTSLEELDKRGEILEITPSTIKEGVYIVILKDGSQANINEEVYNKLEQITK
jgi:hypothetical protein